jgi:flagellar protein FlgJ
MRKTLDPETMFGGDSADVFGGMFDLFLGQQMVQNGGLGLARMLREALANHRPVAP